VHGFRQESLFQLRVSRLGSDEDGDLRVGVLPQREEILIGSTRFGPVALRRVGATQLQMRKCADQVVLYDASVIENFLKFPRGFASSVSNQKGLTAKIGGTQRRDKCVRPGRPKLEGVLT
jgi:hypothetical protein